MVFDLDKAVRKVPDFPKKGILFYDITGLLNNPQAFKHIIDEMIESYQGKSFTHIVAVESRGFLFASPLALHLNIPIILARKKGKLPHKTISQSYDLEYGSETLEIQEIDLIANMNVLIIDDLIATGGTLKATATMLEKKGVNIKGIFSVIGLPFLNYPNVLKNYDVKTLINYETEMVNQ
ncbi:MAG: adenine phosphoribosyltransferase [Planctomycetota bacterium]|nr:MAG: adenine phosphoribosyltransferase [Planctomycetota bacterium]